MPSAAAEKVRIAACAIELLAPDDTVYLDSGSTVLEVARLLRGWDRLTVVIAHTHYGTLAELTFDLTQGRSQGFLLVVVH